MKIYLKDKLVAKPVVFYVRNVPFFIVPFYIFPIKPGRHSGFLFPQFEFGFNNRAGQFLRNAGYYWAINDYMDLTLSGDYYQAEPSWVASAEGLYKLLYVLDGRFKGTYARSERDQQERWDFTASHSQTLSDRASLTAQANFVSSRDYARDLSFNRSLDQRVNRFLVSSLAYSQRTDWASINLGVDRRQDLDADEALRTSPPPPVGRQASLANLTETLPRLSVLFPTRTVGSLALLRGTPFEKSLSSLYLGLSGTFVSFHERRAFVADTLGSLDQRDATRRGARTDLSLSDSRRLLGWLNFAPGLSAQTVVFDHDVTGRKLVPAAVWSAALSTSATFYGTLRRKLGRLEGIRHVVYPSASFSYSPDFPGLRLADGTRRFVGFSGIDISGAKSQRLSFGLDQRFQVKWRKGEEVTRLDNLLSWTVAGSYNFLYREQGQQKPLSQLSSVVRLQPPGLLSADLSWVHDVYRAHPVRNLSLNLGANLAQGGGVGATPELPLAQSSGPTPFEIPWSLGI
jgi:hypothetical protein